MSVINKMLQDLDARQNGKRAAADLYAKPAAQGTQRVPALVVAAAAVGVAALAFGGAFAWRYWQHRTQQTASGPAPTQAKVVIMPAPPRITSIAPAPAAAAQAETPAAGVPAADIVAAPPAEQAKPLPAEATGPVAHKRAHGDGEHDTVTTHIAAHGKDQPKAAAESEARPKAELTAKASGQGKEETPSQQAEAAYRRGLANVQEGYVSDAISALEQALQANPHHESARQTLIRVLIDNRRPDEAMRELQLALALDPRQPSMAMLLARLQIERGGTGIDTLLRTLPFAGGNGEYHAFLAAALQRQQRNREAAEQYQTALRALPQNGVWLMGLGISLQADKRDAEALDAFRKAKNSGTLTPELLSFVDGKIQLLSR
jgi:MSHA biogenesis protein MshN